MMDTLLRPSQLRWSLRRFTEKTPRKFQFGKKFAKMYHCLYSSIEQLQMALWTYMFLMFGFNNEKPLHTWSKEVYYTIFKVYSSPFLLIYPMVRKILSTCGKIRNTRLEFSNWKFCCFCSIYVVLYVFRAGTFE